MPHDTTIKDEPISIVIIGGGIVGLILAAGLVQNEGVRVKVYERARNFREIGAGIGFTARTIQCMEKINPAIVTALRSGGSVNASLDDTDPNSYLRWIDGYTQHDVDEPEYQKPLFTLDAGHKGWETVRRDQFLEDLVKVIPDGVVELQKRLVQVDEKGVNDKIVLTFHDETSTEADAVFACDGIKSRMRELVLGPDNPAAYPQYQHKVAYRALIPMDKALTALGEYKTRRQHMHVGPGAHLIHYPVNQQMIGATVVITDHKEWPRDQPTTARANRKDVEDALAGWCPPVRKLVSLFPEQLDQWALFDLFEYPVATFNYGRICLVGDAAHASSPHHGAGACMGVEDALCLCTLLREVTTDVQECTSSKSNALNAAFETYDAVRRGRAQWLVNSSRRVCDLYQQPEWGNPAKRVKAESCFEEIKDRSYKIWHFDSGSMVEQSISNYRGKDNHLPDGLANEEANLVPSVTSENGKKAITKGEASHENVTDVTIRTTSKNPAITAANEIPVDAVNSAAVGFAAG